MEVTTSQNFIEIRSVFALSEENADVGTGHTSGQRDIEKT